MATFKQPSPKRLRRQLGVAAIEFAIIFPVFFFIIYGIVTYGLIFAAQQTLTLGAAEGARAMVRYQPNSTLRAGAACDVANNAVSWLRQLVGSAVGSGSGCTGAAGQAGVYVSPASACGSNTTYTCRTITIRYSYITTPLVPNLLGALGIPTPDVLTGQAIVQLDES